MKVFVNDKAISIFKGSRAKDAIRKYCVQSKSEADSDALRIKDQWGNTISDDSPLSPGIKIYFE